MVQLDIILKVVGLILTYEGLKILFKDSVKEIKSFTKSVILKLRGDK